MKLLKVVKRLIVLPLTVAADVVTMGGVLSDEPRSYTGRNLSELLDEIVRKEEP